MKIAIIHDWLVTYAGAEKVLEKIIEIYPNADLYSIVDTLDKNNRKFLKNKEVKTSFIQNLPYVKKKYRSYLPLMPIAIEQFDLSRYDLIISSSHAIAKAVITGPDQLHICYCHSPMRYAWDLQHQYLSEANLKNGLKSWFVRWQLQKMRNFDFRTAAGVDYFISNSDYVGRRIKKTYRRDSITIYPNVAVEDFDVVAKKEDFYFTASRMVPYKKIGSIVEAFSLMPDKKLIVIGDGPQAEIIKQLAGPNVQLLGYQPFSILKKYMETARAFIFAAEEDFGIVPVEAQACGTPVIAFRKGGVLETVQEGVTGVFFNEQSPISIKTAVEKFESEFVLNTDVIRKNAERFSSERFVFEFKQFIDDKTNSFFKFRG